MITKNLLVLCLVVVAITVVSGAPRAIKNEDDLKRSVVEFLSQDKEFLTALEHSGLVDVQHDHLSRQKRQADVDMDIDGDVEDVPKEGFFDRAAKFVVELVQRFLKWINTDN
ncbi:uncharacterized protein LOC114339811 isoform X1 [Diabrotica virgifera virgifera]|uniref:Uncharacterized protein LOC114339811 isoform X1 n=1 Tax=Diabrotica virgifera virgifera TaxID=50390 RepID=A0A6P7GAI2_DIAVI|nr:uncharacterized protein LOC114339811 isoform X1 [Diabrotica virgifera virgifera]